MVYSALVPHNNDEEMRMTVCSVSGYSLLVEFAFFMLLELLRNPHAPQSLEELCSGFEEMYGITVCMSYAERVAAQLKTCPKELLRGKRGPGGGYYPGTELASVTVLEVLQTLQRAPAQPKTVFAQHMNTLAESCTLSGLLNTRK